MAKASWKLLFARWVWKLAAFAVAGLFFLSAAWFLKVLMLLVFGVLLWGWWAVRGEKAGVVAQGLAAAAAFCWRALLAFGALLARTTWGRAVLFAGAAIMLFDASWGSDSIQIPLVGLPGLFLAALIVGGAVHRRRRRWEEAVADSVQAAVPGYGRTREPEMRFGTGEGLLSSRLGSFAGDADFSFRVPKEVRSGKLPEIEEHLREVLPAEDGATFGFDWQLRRGWCRAALVRDLPTSITIRDLTDLEASAAGYVSQDAYAPSSEPTHIPIGMTRQGVVDWDCSNLYGSALFCGAPGGGKSCAVRTVLHHCFRYEGDWETYLIDPKRVEFGPLRKYPAVREVATDLAAAERVLQRATAEQARRYAALERVGCQNIHELNALLAGRGRTKLKHVMVVVDEVAELVEPSGAKDAESKAEDEAKARMKRHIDSISRLGRAAGVHLVLATQRPDAKFISGATKSNIQARLAMGGLSRTGSEMAIESGLAANLPGISGRGIWYESGKLEELQVYYTSMKDLDEVSGMTTPQNTGAGA
jgi:hypothetical protein